MSNKQLLLQFIQKRGRVRIKVRLLLIEAADLTNELQIKRILDFNDIHI